MNPELERNFWLELTQRRLVMMVIVLGLIFLMALSLDDITSLRRAGEVLFYAIVVLWGSRDAAQSVVGEIRDRTWDLQRLSSLDPWAMTWGKLLGSTSYMWVGGGLCLLVLLGVSLTQQGPGQALFDLGYYLSVGLIAHAVAMFSSLLAIRRRQSHSRFDVFLYQIAGIAAAWSAWWAWQRINQASSGAAASVSWWNVEIGTHTFYLASLVLFLGWALVGCYRLMRVELQLQNAPSVWIGFLIFLTVYVAGFNVSFSEFFITREINSRLMLALATLAALTYVALIVEPKDRVLYRWLVETIGKGRKKEAYARLQGWMVAYAATMAIGALFVLNAVMGPDAPAGLIVLTSMGFLTRDIAIFMAFPLLPGPKRGDLPAVVTLIMLYSVVPRLAGDAAGVLFTPDLINPSLIGVVLVWAEAAGVIFLVSLLARRPQKGIVSAA